MSNPDTSIACLGWGSLPWDPRGLPCLGPWRDDGPWLPIEFARESADRRITLVICPGAARVRCCWCRLDVADLDAARARLALRELGRDDPASIARGIGWWDGRDGRVQGGEADRIAAWARERALTGVVWTDLPPRFGGVDGRVPSGDEVLAHLRALDGEALERARSYVQRAPAQIDTLLRRRIEREPGFGRVGT